MALFLFFGVRWQSPPPAALEVGLAGAPVPAAAPAARPKPTPEPRPAPKPEPKPVPEPKPQPKPQYGLPPITVEPQVTIAPRNGQSD